jgi:hypothetical protein
MSDTVEYLSEEQSAGSDSGSDEAAFDPVPAEDPVTNGEGQSQTQEDREDEAAHTITAEADDQDGDIDASAEEEPVENLQDGLEQPSEEEADDEGEFYEVSPEDEWIYTVYLPEEPITGELPLDGEAASIDGLYTDPIEGEDKGGDGTISFEAFPVQATEGDPRIYMTFGGPVPNAQGSTGSGGGGSATPGFPLGEMLTLPDGAPVSDLRCLLNFHDYP